MKAQGPSLSAVVFVSTFLSFAIANAQVSTNRNYKQVSDKLHALATSFPQNAKLFVMGYSDDGVAIEGLEIGNGPTHHMLVGTHHGNEYGSTEVALGFAENLAAAPIAGVTMHVVPVININGYNNRDRYEKVNGQMVDPNRDYPGPCGTEGPFHLRSTKSLADFVDKNNIVASATLHTYWPAAVYPWGISTNDVETPYTTDFIKMLEAATTFSHDEIGNSTNVIYPADGTYEDYAFWKHGIWSILFELGRSHNPSLKDLDALVKMEAPGIRKMFEMAPTKRAVDHAFHGQCDARLRMMDLHIE